MEVISFATLNTTVLQYSTVIAWFKLLIIGHLFKCCYMILVTSLQPFHMPAAALNAFHTIYMRHVLNNDSYSMKVNNHPLPRTSDGEVRYNNLCIIIVTHFVTGWCCAKWFPGLLIVYNSHIWFIISCCKLHSLPSGGEGF